jgi:hypothetical protein
VSDERFKLSIRLHGEVIEASERANAARALTPIQDKLTEKRLSSESLRARLFTAIQWKAVEDALRNASVKA